MRKNKKIARFMLILLFISFTFPSIDIYSKSDEEKIEDLEKKIEDKSKEIAENEEKIKELEGDIKDLETDIEDIETEIAQKEEDIVTREETINIYLEFMQRVSTKKIWLKELDGEHLFSYAYNLNNVVDYMGKDFRELQNTVEDLESQKEEYNQTVESLRENKDAYKEETGAMNETYKELNEELIQLEAEVHYEIHYDDSAQIALEDREKLMKNVKISEDDFEYVDYIISHESSWNYKVENPYSGAYGLCQALPGDKMIVAGDDWKINPETQLRWCDGYAKTRYGSWENAKEFWVENNWW